MYMKILIRARYTNLCILWLHYIALHNTFPHYTTLHYTHTILHHNTGIEMQDNKCGDILAAALKGKKIDILINNAGYFYEPVEKVDSLNFEEVRTCIRADIYVIL